MTLDERLRAALAFRAAQARPDPTLYARVLDRRRRRRRATALVPAVTAGVVALAVAAVAVTAPDAARPPTASGTPGSVAPAPLAAVVTKDGPFRFDATTGRLGEEFGPWRTTTAVAAAGDGTRYAFAEPTASTDAQAHDACAGTIYLVRFGTEGSTQEGSVPTEGPVADLAFSADGTRLAYVVRRAAKDGGCARAELHVRTLATGAERVWTDGIAAGDIVMGGTYAEQLSWSPDGRHLAYVAGECCAGGGGFRVLDVTAPGESFLAPPEHGTYAPGDPSCGIVAVAYRGRTGELGAVRSCAAEEMTYDLVTVAEADGAVTATLARLDVAELDFVSELAFAPSGDAALVLVGRPDKPGGLLRWTSGGDVRRVADGIRHVSW
jgi:hypothetical protein